MTNHEIRDKDNHLHLYKEVQKEAKFDLASQITGVLSALIPVLALMGITFDWLTQEWIDNLYVLMVAVITLVVNIVTIIRNHYATKKAQVKNKVLKQHGVDEIDVDV